MVDQTRLRMTKALGVLKQELLTIRGGRASPAILENLLVDAYEGKYKLIELAQISAPETHQLLVQPYDAGIIGNIKRAIELTNLSLTPLVDGEVIRIAVPPLTEERRQNLVKAVRQRLEGARIMVRQIRQEVMDGLEKLYQEKKISEDDRFRLRDEVQKIVQEINEEIEKIGKAKEEELLTV